MRAGCSVISIVCSHHYFCWTESSSRKAEKTGSCMGWGRTGTGVGRSWTLCPLSSSLLPRALHGLHTHAQGAGSGRQGSCSSFWGLRHLGTKEGSEFRCWGCPEEHVSSKMAQRAQAVRYPQGAGIVQRARKLRLG